ncbi:hypothetical protein KR018_008233 [Drosophila ironensis]|nr:hypothetical protein KR018_008233 [Drosophila ironensis]
MDPELRVCRDDYKALFHRSCCNRMLAQPEQAVVDAQLAQRAMAITQGRSPNALVVGVGETVEQKCHALFDANEFEKCLFTVFSEGRNFQSKNVLDRFWFIKEKNRDVFDNTVGDSVGPFLYNNPEAIKSVDQERKEKAAYVPRPLWKVRRDQQKCDVQSIEEKQRVLLLPLERARRRASERIYTHTYMGRNAADVEMMRRLRCNKDFLNPLMAWNTSHLQQFCNSQYSIICRFMKMMLARNPLYNRRFIQDRCAMRAWRKQMHLYHVEYQTRRDCFRMLREVRALRRAGNLGRLHHYVDEIMTTFIELKTQRTLPWKWEFVNDIYNCVALAYCDLCAVPANVDFLEVKNRPLLYMLEPEKPHVAPMQFGLTNIYQEMDREEERHSRITRKLERLEERLRNSRYAIERSYLLYELARLHFKESRFERCLAIARRAFIEARHCGSRIWRFNSVFLACQVHAVLHRFERLQEYLVKAMQLATDLQATSLIAYLEICMEVNHFDLAVRKMNRSDSALRRTRWKTSSGAGSRTSISTLGSMNEAND